MSVVASAIVTYFGFGLIGVSVASNAFINKRYSDLDLLDDNVYFVKERYHHDWHYRVEYESIRRQLIDYLEKNKDKLDDSEIKILDYYINKFKNNDMAIYEKQFNYYFNEQDNSTLENVFIKR